MRKCIVDFVISVAMGTALAVALHFALEGFNPSEIQTREVRTSRPPAAIAARVVAPEVAPAPRVWAPELAPEPREVVPPPYRRKPWEGAIDWNRPEK